MESGEISSEQITASSQYNSNWSPERSRLNYQENGWTPSDDTIREWIQVSDFSGGWRTNWSYVTLVLVWQSDLRSVGRRKARSPRFEPCRTSRDLARIWSEYCSLICTTFTLKKKQEITQHALFIETCLSSAVDIFFCLHCEIWRTAACDHWMWKDCSSTITLKNTLPVRFSEGRGADRSARTSCSGLVQQIVSSSGCVHIRRVSFSELWSLFFLILLNVFRQETGSLAHRHSEVQTFQLLLYE